MDLQLPEKLTANVSAPSPANPALADAPARNHPPYAEMITAALRERNGLSKDAIANYIETNFTDLPASHPALLADHLNRLKINGRILLDQQCYKLAGSALNGAVSPDPASIVGKRRPGRPPKLKPYSVQYSFSSNPSSPVIKRGPGRPPKSNSPTVQVAVPVFEASIDINSVPVAVPSPHPEQNAADAEPVVPVHRGRGRPRKLGGVLKLGSKRGRGRPRILAPVVQGLAPVGAAADAIGPLVEGGAAPLVKKRRGRPPRADGEVKRLKIMNSGKPRKLTGKPLGRPRKKPAAPTMTKERSQDSQLLTAFLDVKSKLDILEAKIRHTVKLVRPSLENEAAIIELLDLEKMASDMVAPPPIPQNKPPPPEDVRLGSQQN